MLSYLNSYFQNFKYISFIFLYIFCFSFSGQIIAEEKNKNLASYLACVKNPKYGNMYNHNNVILYLEEFQNEEEAVKIIEVEIKNRPTPISYDLLAWASYKNGDFKNALMIANKYIKGKK